jgi:hypothetical protein
VLIGYQVSDAASHGRPRGNLSDLYPRWLGARELLLHRRDPYSAGVTREIQGGYYGRPLDAARPQDPKDQQGFAYPVYVAFYLAPTIGLRFEVVAKVFFWLLLVLLIVTVPLWLWALRWRLPWWAQISIVLLTIGSLPAVQGLKLQQMTIVIAALIAAAIGLMVRGDGIPAGILLALATIKPQLVVPLLLWLAVWTVSDLKNRYQWVVSFLIMMAVLLVASEIWLPGWIFRFWRAAREYQQYTGAGPLLGKLIPSPWSTLSEVAAGSIAAAMCWRNRKQAADTNMFAAMISMVLGMTLLIVPTIAIYNQILLLPGILMVARDWKAISDRSWASRLLLKAGALLLVWQWLASVVLACLSFVMRPELVQKAWAVPGWTALTLPVAVTALMLVIAYRGSLVASTELIPA